MNTYSRIQKTPDLVEGLRARHPDRAERKSVSLHMKITFYTHISLEVWVRQRFLDRDTLLWIECLRATGVSEKKNGDK
jgi:hypothetical protein